VIDGDDVAGAGDPGALDDGLADNAAADDGDRRAGHDLGRVEGGATPVVMPQPMRASCSSGRSVLTLTDRRSSSVM